MQMKAKKKGDAEMAREGDKRVIMETCRLVNNGRAVKIVEAGRNTTFPPASTEKARQKKKH
jgi:hypothetical protein